MAKYIDTELLIKALKQSSELTSRYADAVRVFEVCIKLMKPADVVEVVRCKDCKHCAIREYDIIDELECEFFDVFTDPLDYCSRGERKADNG